MFAQKGDFSLFFLPHSIRTDEFEDCNASVVPTFLPLAILCLLFQDLADPFCVVLDQRRVYSERLQYRFLCSGDCMIQTIFIVGQPNHFNLLQFANSKEMQTEKLSLKAVPLANGMVKAKTGNTTDATTYANWYQAVYMPTAENTDTSPQSAAKTTKSVRE